MVISRGKKMNEALSEVSVKFSAKTIFSIWAQRAFTPSVERQRAPMQVPFANELESDDDLLAPEEAEAPISPVTAAITRRAFRIRTVKRRAVNP